MMENTTGSASGSGGATAAATGTHLLEVKDLQKSYGRRMVVRGVSLHVDKGEVVGLLGRNGAGKTTNFRMTVSIIRPEAGSV